MSPGVRPEAERAAADTTAPVRRVAVIANAHAPGNGDALAVARRLAGEQIVLEASPGEEATLLAVGAGVEPPGEGLPDLCLVFGGDGSILRALGRYADTSVPVFGVNLGAIGFLATIDPDELETGLRRAFAGEFTVMTLPALEVEIEGTRRPALNDITFTRHPSGPMAELSYSLGGEEVGHVRCDGLVAATPAGSTGYNLANNGPVMAWGVEGYAVSFVAPHTLTARALVAAPDDTLHVRNASVRDSVAISLDGLHAADLAVGEQMTISFRDGVARLAQMPGSNFYRRLRERFGRLAH